MRLIASPTLPAIPLLTAAGYILAEGGVIGDFHGDAAMGFWGWPLPQPDTAQRACRAALGVRAAFADASNCQSPNSVTTISDFRVGIGIASGRAVAGKIGSQHQVKVTVFKQRDAFMTVVRRRAAIPRLRQVQSERIENWLFVVND